MTTEFSGILTNELNDNPAYLLCLEAETLSETMCKRKSYTDLRDKRKSARLPSDKSFYLLETISLNVGVTPGG